MDIRTRLFLASIAAVIALTGGMAVVPKQAERPPQPFFQDFFSGTVSLQGVAPPPGTMLVACIDDCEKGFESEPYELKSGGRFEQLEVNPNDERVIGHVITFYLVNQFGRIRAEETRPYIGVFEFYEQNLTFVDPMPSPKPTPSPTTVKPRPQPTPIASLPVAGDPALLLIPKLIVLAGCVIGGLGGGLLLVARRRSA